MGGILRTQAGPWEEDGDAATRETRLGQPPASKSSQP